METTRQQKIARLLQKELSDIFQKDAKAMPGVIVSITKAYISPDMSVCRAYISVFPSEKAENILQGINAQNSRIRYELGTRVRHQILHRRFDGLSGAHRRTPETIGPCPDSFAHAPSFFHRTALPFLQEKP